MKNAIDLKNILEQLTEQQAREWHATSERFLYVDDVILSQHGIRLNSLRDDVMYGVLDAIEDALEIIFENAPGLRALD
jgi:hypothetical protein